MKYKFDEFAYLYLTEELNDKERIEFENLIAEDSALFNEFQSIKKFNEAINSTNRVKASERVLSDARRDLRLKISELENKKFSLRNYFNSLLVLFDSKYSALITSTASLIVGIFVGYLVFHQGVKDPNNLSGFNLDDALSENYKINNIQFTEKPGSNKKLTIQFDAVKPVVINGNISDPNIKRILASAILNSDNAGLKMRSINKLAEEKALVLLNDDKIKSALITAVKSDANPGVRKEALNVLTTLNYDDEIRDALLFVLANDVNSGLRISAINALSNIKLNGISLDAKTHDELSNQIENEKSDYIKLRTTALLGGTNNE